MILKQTGNPEKYDFKLKMRNIWYKIITHLVQMIIRLKTTE